MGPGDKTMRTILSTIVFFTVLLNTTIASADDAAISTMANIMIGLAHFPSDSDKQQLAAIANSSEASQTEKTVATAIANIAHKASAADQEKLNAIVANSDTRIDLEQGGN